MFDQLDSALSRLLNDPALGAAPLGGTFQTLLDAEISFATPDKTAPDQETINLFLHETRENRDLREAAPITVKTGATALRRRPPLRVDCAYLVTAWSGQPNRVLAEHRLLGLALLWLSRFARIPLDYFDPDARPGQAFEPPTMIAQMADTAGVGELWHALGIPPRPYFSLTVTLAMEPGLAVEDAIVTTIDGLYRRADAAGGDEERLLIGGQVRDPAGEPVPSAWVRLEPPGETTITDGVGRFVFEQVRRGTGYRLRARTPGRPEAERADLAIPSPSGDYDLTFN